MQLLEYCALLNTQSIEKALQIGKLILPDQLSESFLEQNFLFGKVFHNFENMPNPE